EEAAKAVSGLRTELDRAVELAESAGREQQRAEEVRDRRLALVSEATAAEEAVQAAEEALDKLVASQRERDADFLAAKKALEVKQTELDRARADAKSASARARSSSVCFTS